MIEMNAVTLFEYTCPECELGTVETRRVQNYRTKVKGYPFVVDEALIGVCSNCGSESFAPQETKRWEELFYKSLQSRDAFMPPMDITNLRSSLNLSMEDFARLLGCTRQSISAWERPDRAATPSRMADLLMRLLRHSVEKGDVNVLSVLLEEAKRWGVVIEIRRKSKVSSEPSTSSKVSSAPHTTSNQPLVLKPRSVAVSAKSHEASGQLALAASSGRTQQKIELFAEDSRSIGTLEYDFRSARLILRLTSRLPWDQVDIDVVDHDGHVFTQRGRTATEGELVLAEKTKLRQSHIRLVSINRHEQE
jgi:putative zinc finger/helix-turn-helix YgiT family protein